MADTIATLQAVIGADVSGFTKGMDKVKSALGAVSGLIGGLSFAGIFTKAINEAKDAEAGVAQLNAVLKSTKGAAGVTAESALDLAGSLSKVTRFSDDAVLAGENMLLTFTNIKQNFPDATEVMLDMSQALGQDVKSSAIQLGKALNNLDYNALIRVGVTFTEQQKRQIDTLKRLGKTTEAQKIILSELKTEFGGSAKAAGETFAGQLDILNNTINNVFETLGTALLPTLTSVIKAFSSFIDSLGPAAPALLGVAAALGAVALVASPIGAVIAVLASPIGLVIAAVGALAAAFATDFGGIRTTVTSLVSGITPIIDKLKNTLQGIFSPGKATANDVFAGGFDPTKQVADQMAKIDAANIAKPLADKIRQAIPAIQEAFSYIFTTVGSWIQANTGALVDGFKGILGQIGAYLQAGGATQVLDGFAGLISGASTWLMTNAWPILQNGITDLIGFIRDFFSSDGPKQFIAGLGAALVQVGTWLGTRTNDILNGLGTLLTGVNAWLSGDGKVALTNGFSGIITGAATWIATTGLPFIVTAFQNIISAVQAWLQLGGAEKFVNALSTFISKGSQWLAANAWTLISSGFTTLFSNIQTWIMTGGAQQFLMGISTAIVAVTNFLINTGPTMLQQAITQLVAGVAAWFGSEGGTQFTTGANSALQSAVNWMTSDGVKMFAKAGEALVQAIVAVFSGIGQAIIDSVTSGIKGAIEAAKGMIGGGGGPAATTGSGGGSGGFGGNAIGGNINAGQTRVVGERGPELFTPASAGTVTPNNKLGGGGNNISITVVTNDPAIMTGAINRHLRRINAPQLGG